MKKLIEINDLLRGKVSTNLNFEYAELTIWSRDMGLFKVISDIAHAHGCVVNVGIGQIVIKEL